MDRLEQRWQVRFCFPRRGNRSAYFPIGPRVGKTQACEESSPTRFIRRNHCESRENNTRRQGVRIHLQPVAFGPVCGSRCSLKKIAEPTRPERRTGVSSRLKRNRFRSCCEVYQQNEAATAKVYSASSFVTEPPAAPPWPTPSPPL